MPRDPVKVICQDHLRSRDSVPGVILSLSKSSCDCFSVVSRRPINGIFHWGAPPFWLMLHPYLDFISSFRDAQVWGCGSEWELLELGELDFILCKRWVRALLSTHVKRKLTHLLWTGRGPRYQLLHRANQWRVAKPVSIHWREMVPRAALKPSNSLKRDLFLS